MKKAISILFATLVFLSGMHVSIAKHICGGEIADVSVSFSAEKADCGMGENHDGLNNSCCKNEYSSFSVDDNYTPSYLKISLQNDYQLLAYHKPLDNTSFQLSLFATNVSPPDLKIASNVNLADICVFRI